MNRLSLAELKAQKGNQVAENLEAIKGGDAGSCHCKTCSTIGAMESWYMHAVSAAQKSYAEAVKISTSSGGFIQ